MKFSEIDEQSWPELQPYLDTCLLPLTCLSGYEQPWQTTAALEELQTVMDLVEIPFKGRIVTYPALHYSSAVDRWADFIDGICSHLKQSGFRYVLLITATPELPRLRLSSADLLISSADLPEDATIAKQKVNELITSLWMKGEDVTIS